MSAFLFQKKKLLHQVYEKARTNTTEKSFSGVLKYLERTLLDDYKINLSYKTIETYYRTIVENERDYNIKPLILDDLSKYLGHKSFKEFAKKNAHENLAKVIVSVDGNEHSAVSRNFSDIIINITNSPVFSVPEFVTKHKSSFGLLGILLLGGFIMNKSPVLNGNVEINKPDSTITVEKKNNFISAPQTIAAIPQKENVMPEKMSVQEKTMECMVWNEDHFERVFCDQKFTGSLTEGFDDNKFLLRKIKMPDTLNSENALGKVWYDKSNKKVEFFTNHGIHPENGKTLKPVTKHILKTYCEK